MDNICFKETIRNRLIESAKKYYSLINKKIIISSECLLGASDNKCTIGFVDAKYCLRPKTILDKNHLDKEKPIIKVVPIIK